MPSDSRATTSHKGPKYQGYPYVNPPAFGVPTIDPYTASRWANLPRRPIGTAVRMEDQAGCSECQSNQIERDKETNSAESKQDTEDNPVVDIDLPHTTDNSLSENRNNLNQHNVKTPEESISYRSDDEPVLYIDLPGDSENDLYERTGDTAQHDQRRLNETMDRQTNKEDHDEQPVVYIDIPECSGSGVSERRPTMEDGPSTSVVQETIFYDQFKDRRIELPSSSRDSDDSPQSSNNSTIRRPYNPAWIRFDERPALPTSLNLWSPGASNADASTSSGIRPSPSYLPSYTPEIHEYRGFRRTPEDEFRLPPLPVTEFPEPPPAYTEIDLGSTPSLGNQTLGSPVTTLGVTGNLRNPGSNPPITEQPQRTTVILNGNTNLNRKYMTCQYCRMIVHSLMIRQNSLWTHIAAIGCLIIGMFPCTIAIYCCDCCKGKAHYCPNCNNLIRTESILNVF